MTVTAIAMSKPRVKTLLEFLAVYTGWTLYGVLYPFIGRWSFNYNGLLLRLPGTSRHFVLTLLLWTKSHHIVYLLMRTVYNTGFTWTMVLTFGYLLLVGETDRARRVVLGYAIAFTLLAIIFAVANVNAPHYIYQGLPERYSPNGWQARPQFVLPSPHCTIATISFLALWRRKEFPAKMLALWIALIPPATVLLAEHWIWDAATGIILGLLVHRYTN